MNSFNAKSTLNVEERSYEYYRIGAIDGAEKLPFSLKILLENLLRYEDNKTVSKADIEWFAQWRSNTYNEKEIAYRPARVLMQDFTGVPAIVDLASMRDAMVELGANPTKINPLQPAELVIDHSVQVDNFGTRHALDLNTKLEYQRNKERYQFLKWGQSAFSNFKVVPPGSGIVHQVNLEYLSRVTFVNNDQIYPDTVVGTDSHTTMVNGLGVLAWGVGGIEAEAAMLGQPISMLVPKVVGFKLTGSMPEGTTATDLVLVIVEMLRKHGVVGKFVEFYGPGVQSLPLADRATIGNMAPEYGATCGIFPVDEETLDYMRLSNRSAHSIALTREYYKAQGMFLDSNTPEAEYNETITLDLSTVVPSIAGPKRPQDRIRLSESKQAFEQDVRTLRQSSTSNSVKTTDGYTLQDGAVVIAAITSCTNTSNPYVMLGAGLLAKKAVALGAMVKPWVKPSLAPGSKVVTEYLQKADLLDSMATLNFDVVGYGCTTCIGNSGPLPAKVSQAIADGNLTVCSVLSGNRNFEGRVHPEVKMNYLASPPLVVAYAIAGRMDIDLYNEPLTTTDAGKEIYLKDVWPTNAEMAEAVQQCVTQEQFSETYATIFDGEQNWQDLPTSSAEKYDWPDSTYVKKPPFFEDINAPRAAIERIDGAYALALLGDSVTTDHISPAGSIKADSPAGKYLQENGVKVSDFNSYGSRRGNHEVMMRGTFANIRLRNLMLPDTEGGVTEHLPTGETMSIYDAAMRYRAANTPTIIVAGKEYGTGSSRDWAAKGPCLLGIQAVIAESFERIHRTNLVGMGILPLQFANNDSASSLGLNGKERFSIDNIANGESKTVQVTATNDDGKITSFEAAVRIDTPQEIEYYQNGGILQYVLRQLAKS